jgi:hypothetical protein
MAFVPTTDFPTAEPLRKLALLVLLFFLLMVLRGMT